MLFSIRLLLIFFFFYEWNFDFWRGNAIGDLYIYVYCIYVCIYGERKFNLNLRVLIFKVKVMIILGGILFWSEYVFIFGSLFILFRFLSSKVERKGGIVGYLRI